MNAATHTRVLTAQELNADQPLKGLWQEWVDRSTSLYVLYQSPLWWDHLSACGEQDRLRLVCWHAANGELIGLAPCWQATLPWTFTNWRRWFRPLLGTTWHLLGGEPLLASSQSMTDMLWHQLLANMGAGDWIYCKSFRCSVQEQQTDRLLESQASVFKVRIGGTRPLFGIDLNATWESYSQQRLKKQLQTLRRKERHLFQHCDGSISLVSITTPVELEHWLPRMEALRPFTRLQHRQQKFDSQRLADLAQRGVLQGYLLAHGDRVLAFVIGYQFAQVYHYADVGFDARLESYSPGVVLLMWLLKDLFARQAVRKFNFGVGDAEYKRRFATFAEQDQSLLIATNRWSNRLRCSALQLANWVSQRRARGQQQAGT